MLTDVLRVIWAAQGVCKGTRVHGVVQGIRPLGFRGVSMLNARQWDRARRASLRHLRRGVWGLSACPSVPVSYQESWDLQLRVGAQRRRTVELIWHALKLGAVCMYLLVKYAVVCADL